MSEQWLSTCMPSEQHLFNANIVAETTAIGLFNTLKMGFSGHEHACKDQDRLQLDRVSWQKSFIVSTHAHPIPKHISPMHAYICMWVADI